jgi:hypothetical protein
MGECETTHELVSGDASREANNLFKSWAKGTILEEQVDSSSKNTRRGVWI